MSIDNNRAQELSDGIYDTHKEVDVCAVAAVVSGLLGLAAQQHDVPVGQIVGGGIAVATWLGAGYAYLRNRSLRIQYAQLVHSPVEDESKDE
jgi:hypothetical protein